MKKRERSRRYYARTLSWWGLDCAVHRDDDHARHPFARWRRVSWREYRELKAEGFMVRAVPRHPTRLGPGRRG